MKRFNLIFLIFILLSPLCLFWGCGAQLESISFNDLNKTILINETYELGTSLSPNMDNVDVSYSVADSTIACLLPDGITILGLKEGQTKIYARANGKVGEMVLNVAIEKSELSEPTGLSFDGSTETLSWISVLNAGGYEVSVTKDDDTRLFQVFTNRFCFLDVDLEYSEYEEYQFSVKAKASSSSAYLDSQVSDILSFKQNLSVSNLKYLDGKIEFEYDLELIDVEETGNVSFSLQIVKNNSMLLNTTLNSNLLDENKISYTFNPTNSGQYNIRVYVTSTNLPNSVVKQIDVIKLIAPNISCEGEKIIVVGQDGDLFKYFKTVEGIREEITDLQIEELSSGEEVVYEAYAYRQENNNIYYINSEEAELTVNKLITPQNIQLEKIAENNYSAKISWEAEYSIGEYLISINNLEKAISSSTLSNQRYSVTLEDFANSGVYNIQISAQKEAEDSVYYLDSDIASVTITKLADIEIEYDELSKKFIINSPEINIGAILNLSIEYNEQTYNLVNATIDDTGSFEVSGFNITAGICETTSSVSRSSTYTSLYLESNSLDYNIQKLDMPELESEYRNGGLIVGWEAIQGADSYLVQIKNLTNNNIVVYSGSLTQIGDNISISLSNLEDGKIYEVQVKALIPNNGEIAVQYLSSETGTLTVEKLDKPVVEIDSKEIREINFSWNAVDNAENYSLYLDGQFLLDVTNLFYTISGAGVGEHSFSVVAKSSNQLVLPSGSSDITFYQMAVPTNTGYEKDGEQSIISFDQVEYAGGYVLEIIKPSISSFELNNYTLRNNRVYFTINTADYFNVAGLYYIRGYAIGEEENIIENINSNKQISMLNAVTSISLNNDNYIVWTYGGGPTVAGYDIFINGVKVDDYNYLEDQMSYYVGDLSLGAYEISVIAKGNNISTIDSLIFSETVYKRESLESPVITEFRAESDEPDSDFTLTFSEVENADYYILYLVNSSNAPIETYQFDEQGGSSITVGDLERSVFIQYTYLYVKAFVGESNAAYSNSVTPSFDSTYVKKIFKSAIVDQIWNDGDLFDFYGQQAIIDGQTITNNQYDASSISSEQTVNIIVRNYSTVIDDYYEGIFYIASDWDSFEIQRLKTSSVTVGSNGITWTNEDSLKITEYEVIINFYGLGSEVVKTSEFTTTTKSLNFSQISALMTDIEYVGLESYVGNYEIHIKAKPVSQRDQKVYIPSAETSNQFIISCNLTGSNLSLSLSNDGLLSIGINKHDVEYIPSVQVYVNQGAQSANIVLNTDGSSSILSNTLNSLIDGFYNIEESEIMVYLIIDIYNVLNNESFSISCVPLGNNVQTFTSSGTGFSSTKLKDPVLNYLNDENGNYIVIDESVLITYNSDVNICAEYGEEILNFTNDAILLLPYSWEDVSQIAVYVVDNTNNHILKSNKIYVDMSLYNAVSNVRFENDENTASDTFDNTFLCWDSNDNESQWIVYIYYDSELISTNLTNSTELNVSTDLLPDAGEYVFKISAYGDNSYYNSNLTEYVGVKLDSDILMTNTYGRLNWTTSESQDDISYFRVDIVGSGKETFSNNTFYNSLEEYYGALQIRMKLIGDVSKGVISSDYTESINFYKFNEPSTFSIRNGAFYFGDEGDLNITEEIFRIQIGINIYSYVTLEEMEPVYNFYLSNVVEGEAYGYVAGGQSLTIGENQFLTLNSDKTDAISFERLVVNPIDEEKYLTQTNVDGEITTYLNWNWEEVGNVTTRGVIIYIQPITEMDSQNLTGWIKVLKNNGELDYYYKPFDVVNVFGGVNTLLSVSCQLPGTLAVGDYKINVQKTDLSMSGNQLFSKLVKIINFKQLGTTEIELLNGKLNWDSVPSALGYSIRYTGDLEGYVSLAEVNSYELADFFADSLIYKTYNFKTTPIGNVAETKPEILPNEDFVYIVAGIVSNELEDVIKPRSAGDLLLGNGGLVWNEVYHTYAETADLEIVFYDLAENEIVRKVLSGDEFNTVYPNLDKVFEDCFSGCKPSLRSGTSYLIKYRELGYSNFANSNYKILENNLESGNAYEFKIAPAVTNVSISDTGLVWTSVTLPEGELENLYYDIYFTLRSGSYIYATTVTNGNYISISDIKGLTAYQENVEDVTEIFIVLRGDSEKYISGFNSPALGIKSIEGETGLYIEDGLLKWNHIDGAGLYQISTIINSNIVVYEVFKTDDVYKFNLYINEELQQENIITEFVSLSGDVWSWDLAQDSTIEINVKYDLKIRYIPEADLDEYAIPSDYSTIYISVYKLGTPTVSISNGNLAWNAVANAQKYIIYINYILDGEVIESETYETALTEYSVYIGSHGQSSIEIAVQAVGPTVSGGNIYYINNALSYNSINYLTNSISNFVRNGDIISWNSPTSTYEIVVYDMSENIITIVTTTNNYYDLSLLGLNSALSYKVVIKVKGTSGTIETGYLSSAVVDNNITFNVLPIINEIDTSFGYIRWKENLAKTDYKVTIVSTLGGNTYVYIIGLVEEEYVVKSLTKNGAAITYTSYVESYNDDDGTYIKFWPAEFEENYGASVGISAVGEIIEEVYYLTSTKYNLTSTVSKAVSSVISPTYSYNSAESTLTINWTKASGYRYKIVLINSAGDEILAVSDLNTNTYIWNQELSGSYTLKIQRYYSDENSSILMSNAASRQIVIS